MFASLPYDLNSALLRLDFGKFEWIGLKYVLLIFLVLLWKVVIGLCFDDQQKVNVKYGPFHSKIKEIDSYEKLDI